MKTAMVVVLVLGLSSLFIPCNLPGDRRPPLPVTPTPQPTATFVPTPQPTATSFPTPRPTATSVPTPQPTATSVPTPVPTPQPRATSIPTPQPTADNSNVTPVPTPMPTHLASDKLVPYNHPDLIYSVRHPLNWLVRQIEDKSGRYTRVVFTPSRWVDTYDVGLEIQHEVGVSVHDLEAFARRMLAKAKEEVDEFESITGLEKSINEWGLSYAHTCGQNSKKCFSKERYVQSGISYNLFRVKITRLFDGTPGNQALFQDMLRSFIPR